MCQHALGVLVGLSGQADLKAWVHRDLDSLSPRPPKPVPQGSHTSLTQKAAETAGEYCNCAAQEGFVPAMIMLALLFLTGHGCTRSLRHALFWLWEAAISGHRDAQAWLGRWFLGWGHTEPGASPMPVKSPRAQVVGIGVELVTQAALSGHPYALYDLSLLYRHGIALPQDIRTSDTLFKIAIALQPALASLVGPSSSADEVAGGASREKSSRVSGPATSTSGRHMGKPLGSRARHTLDPQGSPTLPDAYWWWHNPWLLACSVPGPGTLADGTERPLLPQSFTFATIFPPHVARRLLSTDMHAYLGPNPQTPEWEQETEVIVPPCLGCWRRPAGACLLPTQSVVFCYQCAQQAKICPLTGKKVKAAR